MKKPNIWVLLPLTMGLAFTIKANPKETVGFALNMTTTAILCFCVCREICREQWEEIKAKRNNTKK